MEQIAQEDDEHPAQESNRPIGDGQCQHREGSAHDESEKDNIEEEVTGPPRAVRGVAMPEDHSGQQPKGEPCSNNETGGMHVPKASETLGARRRWDVGRMWSSGRRIIQLGRRPGADATTLDALSSPCQGPSAHPCPAAHPVILRSLPGRTSMPPGAVNEMSDAEIEAVAGQWRMQLAIPIELPRRPFAIPEQRDRAAENRPLVRCVPIAWSPLGQNDPRRHITGSMRRLPCLSSRQSPT